VHTVPKSERHLELPRWLGRRGEAVEAIDIKRTLFSVSDFLDWQKQAALDLAPPFQRRSVWKPGAKSYLIDSVVRGLPTPLIFIRERLDLDSLRPMREVIDGQQRLRTLIAFIDESALPDFKPARDRFVVRREHNQALAGKTFLQLDKETRTRILGYEFSTHVLPNSTEDRDILMIFARLNSTGTALTFQELRNAEFFGVFKTLMYQLAYEQLERWLGWGIFSEEEISRMAEVELTSDLVGNMVTGLSGKTQTKIRGWYRQFDDSFDQAEEVTRRFREVMDTIEDLLGGSIGSTVFTSQVYFFTLFTLLYDLMYGLGSQLATKRKAAALPSGLRETLTTASDDLRWQRVPDEVLDAVQRASADLGRRRTRLEYLRRVVRGEGG
jgi:hypothetical protein